MGTPRQRQGRIHKKRHRSALILPLETTCSLPCSAVHTCPLPLLVAACSALFAAQEMQEGLTAGQQPQDEGVEWDSGILPVYVFMEMQLQPQACTSNRYVLDALLAQAPAPALAWAPISAHARDGQVGRPRRTLL